ncbi:MAG: dihydropyrimidinase [Myxococcota bacterium]|jgi:dihydropyrimidinase|nr:dihydropyrimidinase [Myxococcota bacterium]
MSDQHFILIRNGQLVSQDAVFESDLLLCGQRIEALGRNLTAPEGAETIDATGLLVLPGLIDAHVHIALDTGAYRTADDAYQGSEAAAFGGITTVIDFATQGKGQSLRDAVLTRRQEFTDMVVDYALHVMLTDVGEGREDILAELIDEGAPSIKLYTTYRPAYYADDRSLYRLLRAAGRLGITTLVHAENDGMVSHHLDALGAAGHTTWHDFPLSRPGAAEVEAAHRVLTMARECNAPVVIAHNSMGATMGLVAAARREGQKAYCETGPQYLLLDASRYAGPEAWRYILQPPLRQASEARELWSYVERGACDLLITDHCDYSRAQKLAANNDFRQTPGGLPGLMTLLPSMVTHGVKRGRLDWPQLVRMMASRPAQVYGLWGQKGALLPGFDADVVLFDPARSWTLEQDQLRGAAGYSPFEGMRFEGAVFAVLRRGQFVVWKDKFVGPRGSGRYLPRYLNANS